MSTIELLTDNHGRVECLICPLDPHGERRRHPDTRSTRSHLILSRILAAGLLEERWQFLTRGQQRLVIEAVAPGGDTWLIQWAEEVRQDRRNALRELEHGNVNETERDRIMSDRIFGVPRGTKPGSER